MGAYVKLNSVNDSDIAAITLMPEKLHRLHDGEIYIEDFENLNDSQKQELIEWNPKEEKIEYHIEEANHWISYILTDDTEWGSGESPLNFLNSRYRPIGEIGFGAASFYNSKETELLSDQLNSLDLDTIMKKYNPEKFIELEIGRKNYDWTESDKDSMKSKLSEVIGFIKSLADKSVGFYVSWE